MVMEILKARGMRLFCLYGKLFKCLTAYFHESDKKWAGREE